MCLLFWLLNALLTNAIMDPYTLTVTLYTFLTTSFVLIFLFFSTSEQTQDKFLQRLSLMNRTRPITNHALEQVEISPHRDAVEKFERNYNAAAERTYLITMRTNCHIANYIMKNVPEAELLINVAEHPLDKHDITVLLARARSRSF
jgi:hypothetical protein